MQNLVANIKVFFLDLDGTLVDQKNDQISETNVQAIKNLPSGVQAIISTGRQGIKATKFIEQLGVKFAVCANGALIVDRNNRPVLVRSMNSRQISAVLGFVRKNKLAFKCDDQTIAYGVRGLISRFFVRKLGYRVTRSYAVSPKNYSKIMIWGRRRGKIKRLTEQLRNLVPSASVVNSTHGWTIEVTDENATKGKANRYVWEKLLRVKKIEQTAHVGDSLNDSTVVGHVGHLIALKNADPVLKKMASILGPDFRNGGVAQVLAGKNLKLVKFR